MAVVGSSLFMIGGYDGSARDEVFVYDTTACSWSSGPAMVRANVLPPCELLHGCVVVQCCVL